MPLGFPKPIKKDDPRLKQHETVYKSSRGGWFPKEDKPVPGERKPDEDGRK